MSPTEELIYPDIDESIHYPWQDDQQIHSEGFSASVIDPRLYQGLAEQNDELAVDQVQPDYEDQMNHLESNGFLTDEDSGSEYNEEDAR
jgi:general transcription factor 3C polypeptide 3 (transcription factor C subunit 4)